MEWSLKWHSLVSEKYKFPKFSAKWQQKPMLLEIFLKVRPTKRKNVLANLNYISFFTWILSENPKFRFFALFLLKRLNNYIFVLLFLKFTLQKKHNYVPRRWSTSKFWNGKMEKKTKMSFRFRQKSALFRDLQVMYSAKSELKHFWIKSKLINSECLWDVNTG